MENLYKLYIETLASSMIETPKKLGSDPRRHSLSMSMASKLSERQLISPEEEGEDSPRAVLRRDMPICWLDLAQNIKEKYFDFLF